MLGEEFGCDAPELRVEQGVLEAGWVGVAPPLKRRACVEHGGLNDSRRLGPLQHAFDE
jgi:hypothetical protein